MFSGDRLRVRRLRRHDADLVAVADLVARLGRLAVDRDAAAFDDALDDGTAEVGEQADEILIEPQTIDANLGDEVNRARPKGTYP